MKRLKKNLEVINNLIVRDDYYYKFDNLLRDNQIYYKFYSLTLSERLRFIDSLISQLD